MKNVIRMYYNPLLTPQNNMSVSVLRKNACKKDSIDMVATSFRQSIEPDLCYSSHYESCQHQVLLIQDTNNNNAQPMFAYHMHGTACTTRRTYERFQVTKEEVRDLTFIGYTGLSAQELECLCEVNLGVESFAKELTCCYSWPKPTLDVLVRNGSSGTNKLYKGYVYSHSSMNASTQFVC